MYGISFRRWPVGIVIGLLFVIGVNILMAYLAVHGDLGIVTENAYETSLNFEKTIQARKRFLESGTVVTIKQIEDGDSGIPVKIRIQLEGLIFPIADLRCDAILMSGEGESASLAMKQDGNSSYVAELPLAGLWKINCLTVGKESLMFEKELRIID
jgi:nitrogen fixation protein FixH